MEPYEVITQAVGILLTPVLGLGAIATAIWAIKLYHIRITKQIVYSYLKQLQKDD